MYRTVYDLTADELRELKEAHFWDEETQDILGDITDPEDIPDEAIFRYYEGTSFVEEDFFCNCVKGERAWVETDG